MSARIGPRGLPRLAVLAPAAAALLGVLVAPGLAAAQSLDCTGTPTFYPRGDRWATVPQSGTPIRPAPIVYHVATSGTSSSSDLAGSTAAQDAVNRAAASWNAVSCSSTVKPSVALGAGTPITAATTGSNDIYWIESGWTADSATIAQTLNNRYIETGYDLEADMEFNGEDFSFRARDSGGTWHGCSTTGTNAGKCYDVEVVALHELGHFLGFDHVQCSDAVMFPRADPTSTLVTLSANETTGLCALYPPRTSTTTTTRDFGERCDGTAATTCRSPLQCVLAGTDGWCSSQCGADSDCPTGYVCSTRQSNSQSFCKPGPHNTGLVAQPPVAGPPSDFCQPCTSGSQCSNGLCTTDGHSSTGICTEPCDAQNLCPLGMSCVTVGSSDICWPNSGTDCTSNTPPGGLGDQCYDQAANAFTACAGELICFVYQPRPEGQVGACVTYCNDSDAPCPVANQTCCYGVDDQYGNCISTPPAGPHHGGCFAIRTEGQSCAAPEDSICTTGTSCFYFDTNKDAAKCYRTCDSGACGSGQTCVSFTGAGNVSVSLCCKTGTGVAGQPTCQPATPTKLDVGVECHSNADCDSNVCVTYGGTAACSQPCNATTGIGCPGDIDVNGDGQTDGGFVCKSITSLNGAYCWPKVAPVAPYVPPPPAASPSGGCCNAANRPVRPEDVVVDVATWLAAAAVLAWRRRRARRAV